MACQRNHRCIVRAKGWRRKIALDSILLRLHRHLLAQAAVGCNPARQDDVTNAEILYGLQGRGQEHIYHGLLKTSSDIGLVGFP